MSAFHMLRKFSAAIALIAIVSAPACAGGNPLLGKWEVVEAAPAPWSAEKERPALAAEGQRLLKMQITFTPAAVIARHKTLACTEAEYEETQYSADALFQGSLLEPNQDAAAISLGFPRGDVPGVDVTCSTGSFSYHFRDKGTALLGFNNVIYTLKRR
jgi:hypothetical protein